jgi:hypothetical protein
MESSSKKLLLVSLTILSLHFIYASDCSSTVPTKSGDCFSKSSNNREICCYLTGLNSYSNDKLCVSIPNSAFTGETKYSYDNKIYNIECDYPGTSSILEKCGGTPDSKKGCSTGSSFTNSCCYYEKTETESPNEKVKNTKTGCYWLGTKFEGEISWAGLMLACNSSFLTYSLPLLFVFLLFLI